MARPWQYTRSRRTLMQLVMWLILGGTVGLAALVDRYRSNSQNESLGPAITFGHLQLRPPSGWRPVAQRGRLMLREEGADPNSDADDTGRVMVVQMDLVRSPQLDRYLLAKAAEVGTPVRDASPVIMCGQRGLMCTVKEPVVQVDGQAVPEGWSVLAGTVLSNGPGVTIQLHTPRRPTGGDLALVKAVARTTAVVSGASPTGRPRREPTVVPAPERPEDPDGE